MFIWCALLVSADIDADIDALRQRTAELEPRAQILQTSYLQAEAFDREATVKQRIAEGETLYLLGDYARASVLLFDVVTDVRNSTHADYDLALFYLAEASYLSRNIVGARHHFAELLSRGNDVHVFDAFERLIQIGDTLADYSGIEERVAELKVRGKGALRPDVAYLYGKSLSRRGRREEAFVQLRSVPSDHKYYHRALYVVGAEHAKEAEWDEAIACFDEIAAAQNPLGLGADPKEVIKLKELAHLAKGRVLAERGRLDLAMDAYAQVGKDSPFLTQALYEIAWMHVQAASYRRALQAIDILLLAQNDRVLTPKAQLLKGNVLLKLGRTSDAIDAFNRVNEVYEPVYRELTATLTSQKDPDRYFNEIIVRNQGVYNAAAFLPPLAVAWVSEEREVGRALGVANDLLSGSKDIAESKLIGARILATIAAKPAVELFPLFAEGDRRATDAERDLRSSLESWCELMTRAVGDDTTITAARQKRLQARGRVLDATAKRDAVSTQQARRRAAVLLVENEAVKLRSELTAMQARLIAVQTFVEHPQSSLTIAQKNTLRAQANQEARAAMELERQQATLDGEVRTLKNEMLVAPVGLQNARDAYDNALADELGALMKRAPTASIASAAALGKLAILRDRLGSVDAGLRSFRERLTGVVDKRALQIASRVELELQQVAVYERELTKVQKDSASLIGGIAHHSFEDVRKKIYDIVLKADVGLIDIVWKEKDERTETINELVKAQKDATFALDKDFEELFAARKRGQR